jgi:hypothetical protein
MDRPTKLDFARSNAGAASVHQTYAATAMLDKQLYGLLSWRNPHNRLGLAGVKRVFARIAKKIVQYKRRRLCQVSPLMLMRNNWFVIGPESSFRKSAEIDEQRVTMHDSDAGVVMRQGFSGGLECCFCCVIVINAGRSGYVGS